MTTCDCQIETGECQGPKGCRAIAEIERLTAENERRYEALCEIANRASNMMDDDAADWMPSIYKIACEAIGEDPSRLLKAAGWGGTVSINQHQP